MRSDLVQVGSRILDWFQRAPGTNDPPPYQVYVYPPADEWEVRKDLNDLRLWLQAPGREVPCVAISLADLFWKAVEETGWAEELFSQEQQAAGDAAAQSEINRAVAELLRVPVPFSQRVIDALGELGSEPKAAFLYRAGALYPVCRTSAILDDLRSNLACPVTLLYPGVVEGEFGLRFMGRWDPTYNYRALIVQRSDGRN